jgi:23S rRNA (guanosine2251-2'-O)-methyltransferase
MSKGKPPTGKFHTGTPRFGKGAGRGPNRPDSKHPDRPRGSAGKPATFKGGKPSFKGPRPERTGKPGGKLERNERLERGEAAAAPKFRPERAPNKPQPKPRFQPDGTPGRYDGKPGPRGDYRPDRKPAREPRAFVPGPIDPAQPQAGGNRVWLYGIHPVLAALANPSRKVLRIALAAEIDASIGPRLSTLAEEHPLGLPDAEILSREQIDRLLPRAAVHQGLAALVEGLEDPDLDDIARATEHNDNARVVVLDQVTDPHNIGAILRSCAGFGVAAVVLPERHSPTATAVMAKAASGALERVPFVRVVNLARALDRLKAAGFWCVGLAGEASTALNEADLTGKIALVVGAEGEGLRRLTRERCDLMVRIPIEKGLESLNVSNAAAIALYELQRRTLG